MEVAIQKGFFEEDKPNGVRIAFVECPLGREAYAAATFGEIRGYHVNIGQKMTRCRLV
jgi:hypothetical protein